jgi:protein-S-isoprenylcysteine O-methyltransferase Ste14
MEAPMRFIPLPSHISVLLSDCASYTLKLWTWQQFRESPERDVLSKLGDDYVQYMFDVLKRHDMDEIRILSLQDMSVSDTTVVPILGIKNGEYHLLQRDQANMFDVNQCEYVLLAIAEKRTRPWLQESEQRPRIERLTAIAAFTALVLSVMTLFAIEIGSQVPELILLLLAIIVAPLALIAIFLPGRYRRKWEDRAERIRSALAQMPAAS